MNKKILVGLCALFMLPSIQGNTNTNNSYKENITPDRSKVPAFPGADGAGKYTTGGAGGTVYTVTSLADDGSEGTFRWAINKKGPRTIVFAVSGIIELQKPLKLSNGDVTIAGQTAPGDGICLKNYTFSIQADNVIVRFIRSRMGADIKQKGDDAMNGTKGNSNIIIDHCSLSWCTDECATFYDNSQFTLQWCIISESLANSIHEKGAHGYGGIWGGQKASFHHNLLAHHESRVPRLGPRPFTQEREHMDMRNNVFYNWAGNGCYGGEDQHVNIVNNYYKPGPATKQASKQVQYRIAKVGVYPQAYVYVDGEPKKNLAFQPYLQKWGTFYIDGNKIEGNNKVTADNWTDGVYAQLKNDEKVDFLWTEDAKESIRLKEPLDFGVITTYSADKAYEQVMNYAGCCNYRDEVDKRIISDTRKGTATFTGEGNKPGFINSPKDTGDSPWPELSITGLSAPVDSDGDGIPDEWEIKNGLDPNNPVDGNTKTKDPNGQYTNLEVYLNSLVQHIVDAQNK